MKLVVCVCVCVCCRRRHLGDFYHRRPTVLSRRQRTCILHCCVARRFRSQRLSQCVRTHEEYLSHRDKWNAS